MQCGRFFILSLSGSPFPLPLLESLKRGLTVGHTCLMEEMEWLRTKAPMVAVTPCNTTEPAAQPAQLYCTLMHASATTYKRMNIHTVQAILDTEHTIVWALLTLA